MRTFVGGLVLLVVVGCGSSGGSPGADAAPTFDAVSAPDAVPIDPTLVQTVAGPVQGALAGDTLVFLGIPYVAPPVGALRWTHPRPHEPWTTTLAATARGPICPQPDLNTGMLIGDEDCLSLNVWAPKTHAAPAPVMVWLHGGGFFVGSGSDPVSDGALLSATTGVVVVTINYRLGPFGFLVDPALTAEDPSQPSSGNYGFEDQRAALDWVQANIARFGGDPTRVTLAGQSAGSASVCLQMLSPPSAGRFQRAIFESGDCINTGAEMVAVHAAPTPALEANVGCDSAADPIACLRGKTTAEIMNGTPGDASFGPVVDGFDLPDSPKAMLARGEIASKVPVINGNTADEEEFSFGLGFLPVTDDASYVDLMNMLFGDDADAVLATYPSASYASPHAAAVQAMTDAWDICPARTHLRYLVAAGVPVHAYDFKHAPTSPVFPDGGAYHTAEVGFVFGTPQWGASLDADELVLSTTLMGYWGRFIATADPNGAGASAWPAYDPGEQRMVFDFTLSTVAAWRGDACDFWDSLAN